MSLIFLVVLPFLFYPSLINKSEIVSGQAHLFATGNFVSPELVAPKNPLHSDPALLLNPLQKRVVDAISNGKAPLWNPDIYAGAPLLADGQSKVFAPSTWLSLIISPHSAAEYEQWFIFFWFSLGVFVLLRASGLSGFSACVGAACSVSMPFLHVWLLHPIALACCWGPWLLLGIKRNNFQIGSVSMFGVLIAGHPSTTFHVSIIAIFFWFYWRGNRSIYGMIAGVMCAAIMWLPQLSYVLESETLYSRGGNRLDFLTLIDVFWPNVHGHPSTENFTGTNEWASSQLHLGLPCLLLTCIAIQMPTTQRKSLMIVGGAIFCVLLSITGFPGPINHTRFAGIGLLLVSGTAAMGAESIKSQPFPVKTVILILIILWGNWSNRLHQEVLPIAHHNPKPATWVKNLAKDLGCNQGAHSCGRIIGLDDALIPNTASLFKIRDLRGYDLPVSQQTRGLMSALHTPPVSPWFPISVTPPVPILQFATVRAVVKGQEIVEWLDKDLPRAWFTRCSTQPQNATEALAQISIDDRRGCPPVEDLPPINGSNNFTPLMVSESFPELITIDTSMLSEGLVVLSDSYSNDWAAYVDTEHTKTYRAGGFARAIKISESTQSIEFKYEPWSWKWGKVLCIMGLFSIIGFSYSSKKK